MHTHECTRGEPLNERSHPMNNNERYPMNVCVQEERGGTFLQWFPSLLPPHCFLVRESQNCWSSVEREISQPNTPGPQVFLPPHTSEAIVRPLMFTHVNTHATCTAVASSQSIQVSPTALVTSQLTHTLNYCVLMQLAWTQFQITSATTKRILSHVFRYG